MFTKLQERLTFTYSLQFIHFNFFNFKINLIIFIVVVHGYIGIMDGDAFRKQYFI